jgi:hypothetical protein
VVGVLMMAGKPNADSARSSQPCQRMKVRPSKPTRLSTRIASCPRSAPTIAILAR